MIEYYMGAIISKEKRHDITFSIRKNIKSFIKYIKRDRRAEYIYSKIQSNDNDII